jgi:hypothetical protein
MEYNINLNMRLDAGALNTLLQTLDNGPHKLMRGLIDTIISQAREQDMAAQKAAEAPAQDTPPEAVGGTD